VEKLSEDQRETDVTATHRVHVKQYAGQTQISILKILEAGRDVYMPTTDGYGERQLEPKAPSGTNLGPTWDGQAKRPLFTADCALHPFRVGDNM
jgi:hypothetical protein